jgi:hypothetical protein
MMAALLTTACASSPDPQLVSVPQRGLRPVAHLDQIFDYRTAAVTIASIIDRDLGFSSFPITFRFYPNRDAFERALLDSGYDAALARKTATTMVAVGGHRAVLVNDARLSSTSWPDRVAMLAHEVGHSLQYELCGGRRGASDQWLREGFAEWLSIRVIEELGDPSMADIRRERQRALRATGRSKTPRLEQLVTFPQWVRAGERQGAAAYALAFVAVDFILERHGVDAVLDYFRRFAASEDRSGNFRAAFGEDLDTFQESLADRIWKR